LPLGVSRVCNLASGIVIKPTILELLFESMPSVCPL
jgi:hypothetical protein